MRNRLVEVLVFPLLISMGSVAGAQTPPQPADTAPSSTPTTAPAPVVPFGKPKTAEQGGEGKKPATEAQPSSTESAPAAATTSATQTGVAETPASETSVSETPAAPEPAAVTEAAPTTEPVAAEPTVSPAPPSTPVASAPATSPVPASGATAAATPLLHYGQSQGFNAQVTGHLRASYLGMQGIASDRDGTEIVASPLETRVRLAPQLRYASFGLIGEVDVATGALMGLPGEELRLGQSAHPSLALADLRQLYLEYKGETFVIRAGQQASNWGLGLVANNGSADAVAGEFGDARYGDLTYRAAIAGRPFFGLGGAFRAIEPIVAVDMIVRDDTADYFKGDRAVQGVLALRFAADADRNIGIYTVYRQQRLEGALNGERSTDAYVVDLAGRWKWSNPRNTYETKLGFEAAWITGQTTMGRSDTAPVLDLSQFGAVAKLSSRIQSWEGFLDVGYASGDQNPYDTTLQSFRFDPDFNAGLILFEEVMAWQSARTYARATDPDLLGVAPEGADLLPTRGSVTGAYYAFPRVRHGVREWLDVYGGPLFAFTTASMTDPFNTRVDGGAPKNALGGTPGGYLGTELDMGVQARFKPVNGMALSATGEVGYFIPGDAFTGVDGRPMPPVAAGRVRLAMSF